MCWALRPGDDLDILDSLDVEGNVTVQTIPKYQNRRILGSRSSVENRLQPLSLGNPQYRPRPLDGARYTLPGRPRPLFEFHLAY